MVGMLVIIGVLLVALFVWALCSAAGKADEHMERDYKLVLLKGDDVPEDILSWGDPEDVLPEDLFTDDLPTEKRPSEK